MAVAKIIPNKDVIYGGSAIWTNPKNTNFYAPAARVIDLPDASGTTFFQNIGGRYLADEWTLEGAVLQGSGDSNTPGSTNVDAVVYYGVAGTRRHHVIQGVGFGYDGNPTAGSVSVESPSGVPIFGPLPVTTSDAQFEDFPRGMKGASGADMLIRLKAAGSVHGSVSTKGHRVE